MPKWFRSKKDKTVFDEIREEEEAEKKVDEIPPVTSGNEDNIKPRPPGSPSYRDTSYQDTRPPPPPLPPGREIKAQKENEEKVCPKCGTVDCISEEETHRRIEQLIAVDGTQRISDVLRCCNVRQQLNAMKEIEKRNPGIWGKPASRNVSVTAVRTNDETRE